MSEKVINSKINIWVNDAQVENKFRDLTNALRKSKNELAGMTIGSKEYIEQTKKIQIINAHMEVHLRAQKNIAQGWTKMKENIKQIAAGNILANMFSRIGNSIQNAFSNAWNTIKDFSKDVSELRAITGASGNDLDYLKEKAIELAAQYGKSGTEIVQAMKLVGSAKPELLENVEALSGMTEAVLTLSQASGMDLAKTTASLTTIMNQFGHSANLATEDINILAAGSKFGSVEVDYLAEAISKVGTIANSAGLDLEQVTAAMELFGEKGVKAETAGNGFKRVLTELQKDTKNYTNGVFDLNKAIDNNQKIAGDNLALQEKFGQEYFGLAQILFQNKERFLELNSAVTGTNTAFEQAAIAMDNLSGDLDKAKGAWEKLVLSVESGDGVISKAVRTVVKGFTELLDVLAKLNNGESLRLIKLKKDSDYTGQVNQRVEDHRKKLSALNSEQEKELYISSEQMKLKQQLRSIEFTLNRGMESGEEISKNRRAELQLTRDAYTEIIAELEKYKKVKDKVDPVSGDTPDGTPKPKGTGNDPDKSIREAERAYESLRKQIISLQKKYNLEESSEQEKAIALIEEKYDSQLEIVDKFIAEYEQKQATKAGLNQEEFSMLMSFYDARENLEGMRQEEILSAEQKFNDKRTEEERKFQDQLLSEKQKAGELIHDALLNDAQLEKQEVLKKYEDLIALAKKYGFDTVELYKKLQEELKKISEGNAGSDFLGIDWGKLEELYEKAKPYIDGLTGMMDAYRNLQSAKEREQLAQFEEQTERKKELLKNQLDSGAISQEAYNSQVMALDKKLESEKKRIAAAEANRQKKLRRFETIINTAAAVIRFMVDPGGLPGLALSVMAGVAGAMQLGAINKEPIPKMAKGARVNEPTYAQIGEAGPEIVLSNKIVGSKTLGPIADDLARIQEGKQPRFLNRPSVPNYSGMTSAIGAGMVSTVNNNTVINQVDNKSIDNMKSEIEAMRKDISSMTESVKSLKNIRAVLTQDQVTEFEEDERLRLRYTGL